MHERAGIDPPPRTPLSRGALNCFSPRGLPPDARKASALTFFRAKRLQGFREGVVRQPWNCRVFSNRLRKKEMGCSGRGALAGCSGRALCFLRRGFFGLGGALARRSGGCSGGVLCLQGCSGGALCLLWRPPYGFNGVLCSQIRLWAGCCGGMLWLL